MPDCLRRSRSASVSERYKQNRIIIKRKKEKKKK